MVNVTGSGLGVRDVVVRYALADGGRGGRRRELTAVDGVSLDVAPGEVVALLGASGSGKSSVLRAIAGLEPLASGRVLWEGHDLAGTPTHKRGFGMMFQEPALFPSLSVGRNVAYGLHRMPRGERAATVARLLDLVGLPGHEGRRVTELSGGQAQRVALARALAPSPRVLLLDEPLSALDRGLREHLVGVLAAVLRQTGTTAIHVTHDQDEAFALADRVGILAEGRLLQVDAPERLWRRPASVEVASFLGFGAPLDGRDAEALGVGDLARGHRVMVAPGSVVLDPAGVQVAVVEQATRRGHVAVTVELPSGRRAELRVGERLTAGTVGVRADADAVAVVDGVGLR